MSSIPDSIQKVPSNVIQIKRKHPFLTFLTGVGIIIFLAYGGLHFFLVERTEKLIQKNEELALDITNLKLIQDEQVKAQFLQETLRSNKMVKENIGFDNIIPFSYKILSLEKEYRDIGMSVSLLLAVVEVESNFNPRVVSSSGAYGIAQIVRSTAIPYLRAKGLDWSEELMFNPNINIELAAKILSDLHLMYIDKGLEKRDDFTFTLSAYNLGEGTVQSAINRQDKMYLNYVAKVKMAERRWLRRGI